MKKETNPINKPEVPFIKRKIDIAGVPIIEKLRRALYGVVPFQRNGKGDVKGQNLQNDPKRR